MQIAAAVTIQLGALLNGEISMPAAVNAIPLRRSPETSHSLAPEAIKPPEHIAFIIFKIEISVFMLQVSLFARS